MIFVGHASLGTVALSLVSACELSHIKGKVAGRVRSRATAVLQAQAKQTEESGNESYGEDLRASSACMGGPSL
jgi:hypothetical protein